jgi:hypothetical protein
LRIQLYKVSEIQSVEAVHADQQHSADFRSTGGGIGISKKKDPAQKYE